MALGARGLLVKVRSNWGRDLSGFPETTEVAPPVDLAVTSAGVGFPKPHPGIYASILDAVGAVGAGAVLVGDSWEPDLGPSVEARAAGYLSGATDP